MTRTHWFLLLALTVTLARPVSAQVIVSPKTLNFTQSDPAASIASLHQDVFAYTCTAATPPVCTVATTPIGAGVDILESSVLAVTPALPTGQNWAIDQTAVPIAAWLATLVKSTDLTCRTPGCYVVTLTPTGTNGLASARSAASNPFSMPPPPAPPAVATSLVLK